MKNIQAINSIKRTAVQIFSEEGLEEKLNNGRRLKIKLGADPSRPDLHLGHTVIMRQMKKFQDMGHEIIFIIGDFTAMIGDPSGKSKTRPKLTLEETRTSGRTYLEQVSKILDPEKTTVEYNSKWLGSMTFADVIDLSAKYTLARILERDDFAKRYKENLPVGIHELLYPLMQGYDSVMLKADIEVGGTDQTFNLLVGRELQRDYGQTPQEVITFPLLIGLDGKEKMSKSLDNYIGISEPAEVMYEKAMKIPDELLYDYFKLTTDIELDHAKDMIEKDIVSAHSEYGKEIVRLYHGEGSVESAVKRYKEVASGAVPENIEKVFIPAEKTEDGIIGVCNLICIAGLAPSNSEARRLIQGGGIKINGKVVSDAYEKVKLMEDTVISKGKNKFVKILK